MGLAGAEIELINSDDLALVRRGHLQEGDIRRMRVTALVDSGAYMLVINENIRAQLDLGKVDEKEAVLADGTLRKLDIVGPLDVRFENRATTVRAMVIPGEAEVLLGAIPMEDMDVVIDPRQQKLIVNPESPYLPKMSLK
ncbi:MAG: clan AA aspartic protease [Candidatus Nealsonbacteria bacterium]|nr:clan AA aspartic protease [Candidatus Nealsonbacteria bacterium]